MITIDTKAAEYSRTSSPPTTSNRYVNWSSGGTAMPGQRLLGLLATATAVVLTVSGCSKDSSPDLGQAASAAPSSDSPSTGSDSEGPSTDLIADIEVDGRSDPREMFRADGRDGTDRVVRGRVGRAQRHLGHRGGCAFTEPAYLRLRPGRDRRQSPAADTAAHDEGPRRRPGGRAREGGDRRTDRARGSLDSGVAPGRVRASTSRGSGRRRARRSPRSPRQCRVAGRAPSAERS